MYPTLNPKLTDTMFDFPEEARPQRIQRVMPNGYAQHAQTLRLWARHAAPPGRWQTSCTGQRTCESRGGGFVVIWGFGVGGEVAAASHALVVGVGKVGVPGEGFRRAIGIFRCANGLSGGAFAEGGADREVGGVRRYPAPGTYRTTFDRSPLSVPVTLETKWLYTPWPNPTSHEHSLLA